MADIHIERGPWCDWFSPFGKTWLCYSHNGWNAFVNNRNHLTLSHIAPHPLDVQRFIQPTRNTYQGILTGKVAIQLVGYLPAALKERAIIYILYLKKNDPFEVVCTNPQSRMGP